MWRKTTGFHIQIVSDWMPVLFWISISQLCEMLADEGLFLICVCATDRNQICPKHIFHPCLWCDSCETVLPAPFWAFLLGYFIHLVPSSLPAGCCGKGEGGLSWAWSYSSDWSNSPRFHRGFLTRIGFWCSGCFWTFVRTGCGWSECMGWARMC